MRIAQIAPLYESVPPRLYGGTERVVSYLTEELVRQGHDVTLFASGDFRTAAELVPCSATALRLNPTVQDALPHHVIQLERVRQRADEFDILHFHTDFLHMPLFRGDPRHTVTTLHGRLDLPDLVPFYTEFADFPLISISNAQRWPMPRVNWAGTVHHGLPRDLLAFNPAPRGDYLAFLGRISPEKRPDRAIAIAARAGLPLRIAAKVDKADAQYFAEVIRPLIDAHGNVEFIGEINEHQKAEFLGNARALLFPIDWPEPFGLVMIEAMACGTPVLAFRCGSVPEVLEDGVSGCLVDTMDDMEGTVRRLLALDRATVRAAFEQRFTVESMATRYVALYEALIAERARAEAGPLAIPAGLTPAAPWLAIAANAAADE